jgi:hypothetical protein
LDRLVEKSIHRSQKAEAEELTGQQKSCLIFFSGSFFLY